jgi:hypothetical protein
MKTYHDDDDDQLSAEEARELLDAHAHEPEEEEVEIIFDIPRPHRDDRDPYGRTERQMLFDRTQTWDHDTHQSWKQQHPEFAAEYEQELQQHPNRYDSPEKHP